MSLTEHSILTAIQPSWWESRASNEISETIIGYSSTAIRLERREIELKISAILINQPWFRPVKDQLQEFLALNENWNGYGESPIHEEAIKRAVAVLDTVVTKITPRPDVVPTSEGGVQIEWASSSFEIIVEVPPTGPAQILIAEPSGQEHELQAGAISNVWKFLQDNIERMACSSID